MTAEPDFEKDQEGREAERQATSMKDQLSKEVASWSKERRQPSSETIVGRSATCHPTTFASTGR